MQEQFFLTINDNEIYCEILNKQYFQHETPLLIFLHEGLGSVAQWKDYPQLLSDELSLPALLYDRYGFGKSSMLKEKRKIDYYETEAKVYLLQLIEKLNLTNPLILVGHSDGGTIALEFASMFPDNVRCLISEAAHVFVDEISISGIQSAVELFESGMLKAGLAKYHAEKTESMFYAWAGSLLSEEAKDWSIEHILPHITSPVLIIQGENDKYGTDEQVYKIFRGVSGEKELAILPKCGHIPHFEAKDDVLKLMANFIRNVLR